MMENYKLNLLKLSFYIYKKKKKYIIDDKQLKRASLYSTKVFNMIIEPDYFKFIDSFLTYFCLNLYVSLF